jgi:hypothetical protein
VVFWIAALFSIVDGYKNFERLRCLLLHKKWGSNFLQNDDNHLLQYRLS